uniref:G-protein coupled receptors family 1 profile domain-containing protein n=1 Tax=Trichobilharzia regenti TaxID=157069 RepID=A0AA85JRQ5_TRIRE|nr:unnamed protein product [Trichobilharzia regenti]
MLYVQFPLRVIITIEGFIGAILNSLSLFVVFKTRFGSRSTTLMLRLQPIFDMSACFLYAMYTATENGRPTKILFIDKILCYLWSNNIAFWLGVVLSVHNIVCISVDRFIAVLFPIVYKQHQLLIIVMFAIYEFCMIGLLFVPIIFFRLFINGTCTYVTGPDGIDSNVYIAFRGYTWLIFQYILPLITVTMCHALIVIQMKKRQRRSTKSLSVAEISHIDGLQQHVDHASNENKRLVGLVVITALMSSQQAILHSYENIRYFLTMLNIVIFSYGTVGQQMGPFLILLSSCINPCILIGTTVSLRRQFSSYVHKIWTVIRRK